MLPEFDIQTGWGDEAGETPAMANWLKVPPGQAHTITLLLPPEVMPRYLGHWHQPTKQFRRCTAPACALCDRGQGKQQRFVQAVVDEAGTHWIWEFGQVQALQIKALVAEAGGSLAGLAVTLMRPDAPGSPPIIVIPAVPWLDLEALPAPVDAKALLAGVWRRQALLRGKAGEERQRPLPGPPLPPPARPPGAVAPPTPEVTSPKLPPSAAQCFPERPEPSASNRLSEQPSACILAYVKRFGKLPRGYHPTAGIDCAVPPP